MFPLISEPWLPAESSTPEPLPASVEPRTVLPLTPSSALVSVTPAVVASCTVSSETMLRVVPGSSATPASNSCTNPLVTVTASKPALRTPAPTPTPSIVAPLRSTVIPSAPITRPSPGQSTRSLVRRVLVVTTWPQVTCASTGAAVTVQIQVAGTPSVLPATSTARTANVWPPTARPVTVCGEVHGVNAAPSRLHSKAASGSSEANSNDASVATVVASGPLSITVSGAVVSGGGGVRVQLCTAGVGSALPARSTVRTANVCGPTGSPG
ncbi:hypothetical protein BJF78_32240 [Pseudonocardia sp. CNS-139]|nr:hypothetical protein BJF78_32240 [Pseudonocardia sp. CNS-139]